MSRRVLINSYSIEKELYRIAQDFLLCSIVQSRSTLIDVVGCQVLRNYYGKFSSHPRATRRRKSVAPRKRETELCCRGIPFPHWLLETLLGSHFPIQRGRKKEREREMETERRKNEKDRRQYRGNSTSWSKKVIHTTIVEDIFIKSSQAKAFTKVLVGFFFSLPNFVEPAVLRSCSFPLHDKMMSLVGMGETCPFSMQRSTPEVNRSLPRGGRMPQILRPCEEGESVVVFAPPKNRLTQKEPFNRKDSFHRAWLMPSDLINGWRQ